MTSGEYLQRRTGEFQAARRLPNLAPDHALGRLHGHGFLASVALPAERHPACPDAFAAAIAGLDHCFLNDTLAAPSDTALARHLAERIGLTPGSTLSLASTARRGALLDAGGALHVWIASRFEAAHQLPNVAPGHQCGRMHGHGFEVRLQAALDEGSDGVALGDTLASLWHPLLRRLDGACLNRLPGLENPTSEVLAAWLWDRLAAQLPALSRVTVRETDTAGCHYDGSVHRIWKDQRFEAATGAGGALHGHSYLLRLRLAAPLHQVLGWTVDYGDVKQAFQPLHQLLDHHRLDTVQGLAADDATTLITWLRERLAPRLPELEALDLWETPARGLTLAWGQPPSPFRD